MPRDESRPAPGWAPLTLGVWRRALDGAPAAEVRLAAEGYALRLGGGPWLAAGATLLRSTEHAGWHQSAEALRSGRGIELGPCPECARLAPREAAP